jgi:hypothetical protein
LDPKLNLCLGRISGNGRNTFNLLRDLHANMG